MLAQKTTVPSLVRHPDRFFIGGEWCRPASSRTFDVIHSTSEGLFMKVAEAGESDINHAVSAARKAFDHGPWPRLSHQERAAFLRKIGAQITARTAELSTVWASESGILRSIGEAFMSTAGQTFEYYADLASSYPFEERHTPQYGDAGLLVREPVGVVAAIIPWNGPMGLIVYKLAPALLAGCTVVLKLSPEAPVSGHIIGEICESVGLPPGAVNVVTADRQVSELLVRHPGIDKVTFTGSTAAGKLIAGICAQRVARVTLELGGKSAALILEDCDIEAAAESISQSARVLTGQVCASLTRLVVVDCQHERFLQALKASVERIRVGDPFDPQTDMGPLAMRRQRDRVEGYISKGKEEGARVVSGGGRPRHLSRGFFIEPTVFSEVRNDMTIAQEEIFGPVLSVIRAKDENEAINIANDSIYGLNASVFTRDPAHAYAVARRLRSGTVGHNAARTDFTIAFGGFKQSGIGREGGAEGLMSYLETHTMLLDGMPGALAS